MVAIMPKLDAPGAGIPWPQKLLLRYVVRPLVAARSDWDQDSARFNTMTEKTIALLEKQPLDKLEKRVLVPPQRGLEDSSRFWSAAMTLQHMVIVGKGISGIIVGLSKGNVPARPADTAAVKPADDVAFAINFAAFKDFSLSAVQHIDANVTDKKSKAKFQHPWFGGMTAHEWHWLLGIHHGLHLQQLREIISHA